MIPAALALSVVVAVALAVGSDDARLLRLGVVAALWAALFGAFAVVRFRREAGSDTDRDDDLRAIYQLELEREVAARQEHALTVEAEVRRQVEEESRDELEALRAELRMLRENLEVLLDGQLLVERVALRAESTRLRLPESGSASRNPMSGRTPAPRPARRSLTAGDGPATAARDVESTTPKPTSPPPAPARPRTADDMDTVVDGRRAAPPSLPRRDPYDRSGPTRRGTPEPTPSRRPPRSAPIQQPAPVQQPAMVQMPVPKSQPVPKPDPAPRSAPVQQPAPAAQPVPVLPTDAAAALTGEVFRSGADPLFDKDWRPEPTPEPPRNGSGPASVPFAVPVGYVEDYAAGPALSSTNGHSGAEQPSSRRSRRRHEPEPDQVDLGRHRAPAAETGGGGGRRRKPEEPTGSHAAGGRSVQDLISAYQAEQAPRGRHGR